MCDVLARLDSHREESSRRLVEAFVLTAVILFTPGESARSTAVSAAGGERIVIVT